MVSVGAPRPPSPTVPVGILPLPRAGTILPPTQGLATSPLVGITGQQVTIQQTVRNLGTTPTIFSFKDKLFLSADAVLDTRDLILGETPVGNLPAGAVRSTSLTTVVPDNLATGLFTVFALADS